MHAVYEYNMMKLLKWTAIFIYFSEVYTIYILCIRIYIQNTGTTDACDHLHVCQQILLLQLLLDKNIHVNLTTTALSDDELFTNLIYINKLITLSCKIN